MKRDPSSGDRGFHIRTAGSEDEPFLWDMLREALFVPPGQVPFSRSVVESADLRHYVEGFGTRNGDNGLIAIADDVEVGAAWVRIIRGYGFVDDATPELTVAVRPAWRGRGVGTALLRELLDAVPRVSLSSDRRNQAVGLYERLGFAIVRQEGDSVIMVHDPTLRDPNKTVGL